MEKLKFEFLLKGTRDAKSNIVCITSITTPGEKIYILPIELQNCIYHTELINTDVFAKVKKALKKKRPKKKRVGKLDKGDKGSVY